MEAQVENNVKNKKKKQINKEKKKNSYVQTEFNH